MERLPRELVSNVLSKLSAKELMRCKCVCKSWFDLITDPLFISNYYVSYNSQEEKLLVIRRPGYFCSGSIETEISILSLNPKGLISSQLLNPSPYQLKYWAPLMGPCNGIYCLQCLQGKQNTCVIMNPSLRQFITLPQSHFTPPHDTHDVHSYPRFGFDPKTNDYKVVVLNRFRLEHELFMGVWIVELYSLNSNSWRNLGANAIPFPFETNDLLALSSYVNNCCHWWGYVYINKDDYVVEGIEDNYVAERVILSFDMVNELFRKIKVPQITHFSGRCFKKLTAFTESATIGLVVHPVSRVTDMCFCFDVWVMKDYWDDKSWIKQYSIGPLPVIYKQLVGFYGSNNFLWQDANARLVLYDPHCEDQTRNLQVGRKFDLVSAARYMESLVSLKRGNQSSSHE